LHDLRAELRGLRLRHVRRPDELVGQQQIHHAHVRSLGLRARLGDLLGVYEAEVHQQIHQIIVLFSHNTFALHGITTPVKCAKKLFSRGVPCQCRLLILYWTFDTFF